MSDGLYAPAVVVNNVPISIKPNSFTYKDGFGERKVRVASTGGGSRQLVTTQDVETQKGYCKFILLTTRENADIVREWLANGSSNTIEAVEGAWSRTFQQAIVMNDPEVGTGIDGEVEVEFESEPAV